MQELVLAFCNVLQELIAQYVNKKFKEVEQFMRTFEQETMDQTQKISALEDSFKQEIAKQRLAVKKNKLRISGEDSETSEFEPDCICSTSQSGSVMCQSMGAW